MTVDSDDVLFALVRGRWLDSPRRVAAGLLEAAEHPDLLNGVTPRRVMVTAGNLLFDDVGHAEGIAVYRRSVQGSEPGDDDNARFALAMALAQVGDHAEAEAVAHEATEAEARGSVTEVVIRIGVADSFAKGGSFDCAERWARSAVEAARGATEWYTPKAVSWAETGASRVLRDVHAARDAGFDNILPIEAQYVAASLPADPDPWPALTRGCLVWWPEPEYLRLTRQIPDVAGFLGSPWRDHTVRVEAAMRLAEPSSGELPALVAAACQGFVDFIERVSLDPREPATMTAFTETAAEEQAPVDWPPRPRKRCWCGSGRRYQSCCRTPGG